MSSSPAAKLRDVSVRYPDRDDLTRPGTVVLGPLDLTIEPHERWVVLGPNGSGKTSLMRILSLYQYPSTGTVEVLGERWGHTDVRELRKRIAVVSAAMREQLRDELLGRDVVMTARHAALETWWHTYTEEDEARALECLASLDALDLADREFATMSSGEQQRTLLARMLMPDPGLVLLDEPAAGLDLAGREQLVADLERLATDSTTPPMVLITHHPDEIPPGMTHALLLRDGRAVTAGPIDDVMTADALSECFGLALSVARDDGRWHARAVRR